MTTHRILEQYEDKYEAQRQAKKLRWLPSMGKVELTVEMDDGSKRKAEVTPLEAAVVETFSQQSVTFFI